MTTAPIKAPKRRRRSHAQQIRLARRQLLVAVEARKNVVVVDLDAPFEFLVVAQAVRRALRLVGEQVRHRDHFNAFVGLQALPYRAAAPAPASQQTGLDLARTLVAAGHRVSIVASEHLFWPHEVGDDERAGFIQALENMGFDVVLGKKVTAIKKGKKGKPARRVVFEDGGWI